ncbi:SAC3/GANP/THP3 [Arabidopsis thaliana x Arabidopsis arenosa]|uniref:SAC3/GANP/THP3 n=1 Tax=Arabidopsis thaliana x Arabidopsis arenosa TaxID=1240361 RepID=A0A8T2AQH1_9BRAS|nr:SAC3/GANP/THP3 [Arabidopsis thaliana x Arabidopsis arenosa]
MAFRPFGKDVGPSMSSKPSPFTPFGASAPTSDSPIQPPASQNPSAFAGQSFGPGRIQSGPPVQRAPPPLASQNPPPSIGKPYRPGGVQSSPPINRTPSPLAFQNPSPSSGQPYQPGGIQRSPEPFNGIAWGSEAFPRPSPSVRPYQFPGVQRPTLNPQFGHDGSRNFLKDHGEHSRATSPPATSHILSRMGTDAVEIGRSQDSKRKSRSDILPDQTMGFSRRNQSPVSGFENGNLVDGFQPPSSQTWMRSLSSVENNRVRSRSNPNRLIHQEQTRNSPFPYAHEVAEIQEATRRKSSAIAPSDKPLRDDPILSQHDSQRFSTSPPTSGTKTYTLSRSSDSQFPGQPSSVNSFNNAGKTSSSPATKRTRSPPVYPVEEDIQQNSFPSQDCTEGEEQARAKRLARFKGELEPIADRPVDTQLTKSPVNKTMKPLDNKQTFNSLESSRDALKGDALPDYESSEEPSLIIGLCPDMCPESERGERERKGDLDHYERVDGDRNQTSKSLAVKKYTRTAEREAILIRPMPILQNTMEYLLSLLDRPYNENFLGMYNFLWDRMRAIRMDLRMQHIFNQEAITLLEQMIRLHIIAMHELCEYTKGEGFSEGFDAHLNIEQMNKTSVELFQMYDDHRKKGITVPTEKEFRGYYALLKLDKHPGYKVEPSELSLDLANMTPEIRQTSEVLFARNVARACRTGNFIAFFRLARKASYLQACLMHAHFSKLRTQALASLHSGLQINQGLPVSDTSKWIGMEEEDIEALLEYHGFSIKVFEEPYMVKNDLFLHAEKDYKTKCSKLVHMKKSRTIVEDVSAPSVEEDVSTPSPLPSLITETTNGNQQSITAHKQEMPPARSLKKKTSMRLFDKEMADSKTSLLPEEDKPVRPFVINPAGPSFINPVVHQQKQNDLTSAGGFHSPVKLYSPIVSPRFPQTKSSNLEKQPNDSRIGMSPGEIKFPFAGDVHTNHVPGPALQQSLKSMPMGIMPVTTIAESPTVENKYALEESVPEAAMICTLEKDFHDIDQEDEDENGVILNQYDEEVAKAKLKLIIRLWKRWSSRQSELRERRQLAAAAALNSLSLGTPIRFSKTDQSRACGEFNIDQAMKRRFEEREKSWSRLNISDVIADILVGRNPESKCICWKVILCTQTKSVNTASSASQVTHSAASRWLSSKLMPHAEHSLNDDNLLFSAPGVSVWNKWVANESDIDFTCCLSVARDVEAENDMCETTCGASAVLFLASGGLPLNLQREQLNRILESVPNGSVLPLLVVISSCNGEHMEPDTDLISGLGLHDIDKSKIASFSIVSIANKSQKGQEVRFFNDSRLRDGIKWLASNSPLQPNLHHVKPRELVLTHFSFSLELLKQMPDQEVGPNICISAFNDALETSRRNITSAAEANPIGWPCHETKLLEDNRKERLMVKRYLPNLDWSSAENVEPLSSVLENCKLPYFEDDLTWLTVGCASGAEIENHTQRLEGCLVEYLTQRSNLMGASLATKETGVMLERNTRLELHNSSRYHIIPRWIGIFQRIFNWRIMGLFDASSSLAYVLKSDLTMSTSSYADKFLAEDASYPSSRPNLPLLHEMIQISCSPFKSSPPYDHKAQRVVESVETEMVIDDHRDIDESILEKSSEAYRGTDLMITEDDELADGTDRSWRSKGKEAAEKKTIEKRETERLDELLEKCNLVQNSIAEKLCIYF